MLATVEWPSIIGIIFEIKSKHVPMANKGPHLYPADLSLLFSITVDLSQNTSIRHRNRKDLSTLLRDKEVYSWQRWVWRRELLGLKKCSDSRIVITCSLYV